MTDLHDLFPRPGATHPAPATESPAPQDGTFERTDTTVRAHADRQDGRTGTLLRKRFWAALAARPRTAVGLTVLVYFVLGLLRSFVPHAVGLADNGAGGPVACHLGVEPDGDGPRYTSFAIFRWAAADVDECGDASGPHLVALTLARWVSTALGAGALDLRVLLVAYCLVVALLATLVGRMAAGRRYAGSIAGALTWIVLMDAAFVGYAASLYPHGAAIGGLVICTAGLLLDGGGWRSWAGPAAVVVGGGALVGSSIVAALAVVPLVALLAWRAGVARRVVLASGRHAGWIVPTASALVLLIPATVAVASVSDTQRKLDTWDFVSMRVLADSPTPGPALESMGIPADAARFVGTPVWSPSSVRGWTRWPELEPDALAVSGYVATRPALVFDLFDGVVRAETEALPARLGSYDVSSGAEPGAQDSTVSLFTRLQGSFLSFGVVAGVMLWALLGWIALVVVRAPRHGARSRNLAVTSLVLLGVAVTQVAGTALTESSELARQVVAGNLAGGLALCLLIAAGLASEASQADDVAVRTGPDGAPASA